MYHSRFPTFRTKSKTATRVPPIGKPADAVLSRRELKQIIAEQLG